MGGGADVTKEGWVSKKKGVWRGALFKSTTKRYCKLRSSGVLDCYDKERGGELLTSVLLDESSLAKSEAKPWVHIKGYNDVKSNDTYLRIQGDTEVPGDTEEWHEKIQAAIKTRLTRSDDDIREAANDWLENPAAAKMRYGHISDWDVSQVTDMSNLFMMDSGTFNEDLSRWQTGNVENMSYMFSTAKSFTSDLSKWQTGNVEEMCQMFYCAEKFNSDLSLWDTSYVQDMSGMFEHASSFDCDLSKWKTGQVLTMRGMFDEATSLKQKPAWFLEEMDRVRERAELADEGK